MHPITHIELSPEKGHRLRLSKKIVAAMLQHRLALVAAALVGGITMIVAVFVPPALVPGLAPVLRQKIVAMLSQQFASPAGIAALRVRYEHGFQIQGEGLQVQTVLHGVAGDPARPMLRVARFAFRMGLSDLLWPTPTLRDVTASGLLLDLPATAASSGHPLSSGRGVALSSATIDDAHVRFESSDARRASFVFDFPHGVFHGIRSGKPFQYDLTVDNGSPIGLTRTTGNIGPWNFEDLRKTPVNGQFSFENKDVSRVRGLRGRLTLHGTYSGTVARMRAEGTTDDPVFGLDVSGHTVALHTRFAITMDTIGSVLHLDHLDAQFLHTRFVCSGNVTKDNAWNGYNLDLHLQVPDGRIEDALALAARTRPPILRGRLGLEGELHMPAGPQSVSEKLRLGQAHFTASDAFFSNEQVQRQVDAMSERALGQPRKADAQHATAAPFQADGTVSLENAILHLDRVAISTSGAQAVASGRYHLGSTAFELDGVVHTEAQASNMTTGLKSLLVQPFNGLFSHGRSGATLPLIISGKGNEARFEVELPGGKRIEAPAENR